MNVKLPEDVRYVIVYVVIVCTPRDEVPSWEHSDIIMTRDGQLGLSACARSTYCCIVCDVLDV